MTIRLSTHFTLDEMCACATAQRLKLTNLPTDPSVLFNLRRAALMLEGVRRLTGDQPLIVHSGYRSKPVNDAVGSKDSSYHLLGLAADFDPPKGWTHDQLQHAIKAEGAIDFDLCLEERAQDGSHWLHLQAPKPGAVGRRLLLDAELAKQGGKITRYTAG